MAKRKGIILLRYIVLIAIVGAIIYGIIHYTMKSPPPRVAPKAPVTIAQPKVDDLNLSLTVQGYVEARNMVAVMPLVSGTIEEEYIEVGHKVKKGDRLVQLDNTPYRQQMLQAQAARIVAQTTFDRIQRLYANGAVSDQHYEEALAQRDASEAQWELATFNLDNTSIEAPISGTILKSFVGEGNLAHPQQPVALITDLSDLIVRLAVSERYYDRFQEVQGELQASISKQSTTGQTITVQAIVESVAPYIDPASRTFDIVCRVVQDGQDFIPGMLAKVEIIYKTLPSQLLLQQADRTTDGSFYIYDEETSVAEWTMIEPLAENDLFIALPQIYQKTWFIVDGHRTILDGQKVTVKSKRED